MTYHDPNSAGIGQLIGDIGRDLSRLVADEIQLARSETGETVHKAIGALVTIGIGLAIAVTGLVVLAFAAVTALSNVWEPWLASLVVGGALLVVALIMAKSGQSTLRASRLTPRRTRDNLRRDRATFEEATR